MFKVNLTKFYKLYQSIFACAAVLIFVTEADVYYGRTGQLFDPLIWIVLFIIASFPLYLSFFTRLKYLPIPVIVYSSIYVIIAICSFLLSDFNNIVFEEFRSRILTVIFLFTMLMFFSQYEVVLTWAKRAIVVAGLIAVGNNIYEFFNPGIFGELNETGRPAGFYVNPNLSGCSLIIILIFGITALPKNFRIPYILIIGVGILLTFSRGSIMSLILVTISFYFYHIIPRRQSIYWGIILGISITLISIMGLTIINLNQLAAQGLVSDNVLSRIAWFQNPSSDNAYSEDSRKELAQLGWNTFSQHPFFGNGLATSHQWKEDHRSTHNMYLYFMVDHGFLGFFIYPLFVYSLVMNSQGETKKLSLVFQIYLFFWGFFSHTVLTQRGFLLTFAIMANLSYRSQLNNRYLKHNKYENNILK